MFFWTKERSTKSHELNTKPVLPQSTLEAKLFATEHQDVAVRIAHFELPVTVGLALDRHLDECLTAYSVA